MGTEVLRPQNCIIERIRVSPASISRRRYGNGGFNPSYYGNGRFNKKPVQRKRVGSEHSIQRNNNAVTTMENVTILRQGELLDLKKTKYDGGRENGSVVSDPDTEMISKHIEISDVYAGSAFAVSPAPSSLPFPSFSKKRHVSIDDSATRDLRRLLRLDL